jgi:hypothetical protein
MSKDAKQIEQAPQGDEQLIKEIETALRERAQFVVANDPQCCQLQGALDYATGKYRLKQNEQSTNGASE